MTPVFKLRTDEIQTAGRAYGRLDGQMGSSLEISQHFDRMEWKGEAGETLNTQNDRERGQVEENNDDFASFA